MRVLVFHGFGSSPSRIKWLIKPFKDMGLEVKAPKLPSPLVAAYEAMKGERADLYAGHSMGGALALLKASEDAKPAIAVAPPTDLKAQMEYMRNNEKLRRVYEEIVNYLNGNLERMYALSPINRNYDAPILIIHGTEDDVVPIEQSERFCERVPNCKLVKVEGMGHVPKEGQREAIAETIKSFWEEIFGKKNDLA